MGLGSGAEGVWLKELGLWIGLDGWPLGLRFPGTSVKGKFGVLWGINLTHFAMSPPEHGLIHQ